MLSMGIAKGFDVLVSLTLFYDETYYYLLYYFKR